MSNRLPNFDFNQLRALHFLLEEASIAQAATRLSITPAAASNALRRLRELLDDPLLVRAGQHMVRTPLADSLREPAQEFMRAAESIVVHKNEAFNSKIWQGTFSIMTSDYVYLSFGSRLETLLKHRVPKLNLTIDTACQDYTDWLRHNDGLAIAPEIKLNGEIQFETLFSDRMVLAMRSDHPLASKKISLNEYCKLAHILVSLRGNPSSLVDDALQKIGRKRRVARIFPTHTLAAHIVAQSDYVSVLPERFVIGLSKGLKLIARPLPLQLASINFGISWHRRHETSPIHTTMRALLKEAVYTK